MVSKKALASLQALVLAMGFALVTGCATTSADPDNQRALQVAEEAQRTAQQALDAARAAQQTADESQRCCNDNQRRLERLQERQQQK